MSSPISTEINCRIIAEGAISGLNSDQSPNQGDSLFEHVCLFADCQTTGASPASGGNLLEAAWCIGSASGSIDSEINSALVAQPDKQPIPFIIQSLTGITDDAMCDAISSGDLVERLLVNEQRLSSPQLCVIHYARFETPFLNLLVEEHGDGKKFPYQLICTFEIARRLYPNLPSRGIRALGGFLGIDLEEMKRSYSHVGATRVIWKHLVERLSQVGITRIDQLQEFLATKAERRTGKLEFKLEPLKRLELPNCPGVYRMLSQNGRVLYVGKATSLKSRVNSHFRGRKNKTSKSKELLTQVANIEVTECSSPLEAALLETDEIKKFDPPYNISLKQRSRSLLFASTDFLSFSEQQDENHSVGPLPNPRALDALLRLNATINSGIIDPLILFEEIPMEDLVEGLEIFFERHAICTEYGTTPRALLALGLSLFRSARRLLRKLAIEQALEKVIASNNVEDCTLSKTDEGSQSNTDSDIRLAEIGRSLIESDDPDDAVFEESDELTPEEIAERLESLLIGIARTYLVSKEMTYLLNSTIRFDYKSASRDLVIRNGQLAIGTPNASREENAINVESTSDPSGDKPDSDKPKHLWSELNVCDYDRMRVLLTEITRMRTTTQVEVFPPLSILSRW